MFKLIQNELRMLNLTHFLRKFQNSDFNSGISAHNTIADHLKKRRVSQYHSLRAKERLKFRDKFLREFIQENDFPSDNRREHTPIPYILNDYKDLKSLREGLDTGKIASIELVMTYIYESANKSHRLGALADINYKYAKKMAMELDLELQEGRIRGPLHGIPISLKDELTLEGTLSTNGLIALSDNLQLTDGCVARVIKEMGGIPFVKSNVPQLLMIPETDNNIFGLACNPRDPDRTPGGSSGGEAALIASRGSPAGIGTDIGGSIRIPAAFCGLYGFKPSAMRTTFKGNAPLNHEYDDDPYIAVFPVSGPLGRSVDDLIILQKGMISPSVWEEDVFMPPIPFDDDIVEEYSQLTKKMKIGYMKSFWSYKPTDPALAAIDKTIDVLKKAGHEVIEMDADLLYEIPEIYGRTVFLGDDMVSKNLKGEKPLPHYELLTMVGYIPAFLKPVVIWVLSLFGMARESTLLKYSDNKDLESLHIGCLKKLKVCDNHMEYWKENDLDCMILPATGMPPLKHGQSAELLPAFIYTAMLNALDYPAGVIPDVITIKDEHLASTYTDPVFGEDESVKATRECLEGSKGLGMAIQVATLTGEEEKCLGIMKHIDTLLKK